MVEDFSMQLVVGINYTLQRSTLIKERDVVYDTLFVTELMERFLN